MAELILSKGEKVFIMNGIKTGVRQDGRGLEDFRSVEVQTGVVPHCYGSSRIKLASTDVMVGVKAEIAEPSAHKPKQGRLHFFVDCSAIATPDFEGHGGSGLGESIATTMTTLYDHPDALDLSCLCIIEAKKCWCLYVDILLLEIGGNLYDAVSMAVKAALFDTRIPNLRVVAGEHGESEMEVPDDPADCATLSLPQAPILLSLNKAGDSYIVDASLEEENCVSSSVIVGVMRGGVVVMVRKDGVEGLESKKLSNITQTASRIGGALNEKLLEALHKERHILSSNDRNCETSIESFVK